MKILLSVRTIILAGSLLLQLSTLCFRSHGAAGDVDLAFDPGSGVNRGVTKVALQPDGKVIIGGGFTTVKGLVRTGVARLNADGSGDSSFIGGVGDSYAADRAIALQSNGNVLVGNYYGIARLNSDGSLETNFFANLHSLHDDYYEYTPVESIAVQSDGKVLIGGEFYTANGTSVSYGIARLNANGSPDNSFNAATLDDQSFYYRSVFSVALQPDGKVLVGGQFGNGTNNNIARLNANGSLDSSFSSGAGPNSAVRSVVVQPDGKVLISGDFTLVNGTNRNRIARLNANGSLDSSFDPGTGANSFVSTVALQSNGKVLIGGSFTDFNGTNRNGIARLDANGSLDASFNPGTGVVPSYYSGVNSLVVQANGQVLIGGDFSTVNGNRMARLNADGSLDGSFLPGKGLANPVSFLALPSDGKVLIGGAFTFVNGTNQYGSARLNADGSLDSSFIPGSFTPHTGLTGFDYLGADSLAVQPDGKVLIGGYTATTITIDEFNNHYYSFGCYVTRVNADGSRDTNFSLAVGGYTSGWGGRDPWSPTVRALAAQADGKVIVGGNFGSLNGTNRYGIARLNANGTLDPSFNPGIYGVNAIALQPDGKVLIGGAFITFTNRYGIARLNANGTLDNSFDPGTGASDVSSLALQPDGKVLIAGGFTTVNGTGRNRIARLNANGSLDSSFNPGTGADGIVRSIKLQPDGKVLISGDFLAVNGVVRPYVARLLGDSNTPPSLNIARSNAFVIVSWPVTGLNFQLQESTNLPLVNSWFPVGQSPATNAGKVSITLPGNVGRKFFRLKLQ